MLTIACTVQCIDRFPLHGCLVLRIEVCADPCAKPGPPGSTQDSSQYSSLAVTHLGAQQSAGNGAYDGTGILLGHSGTVTLRRHGLAAGNQGNGKEHGYCSVNKLHGDVLFAVAYSGINVKLELTKTLKTA